MNIKSQLENAQIQHVTSDPSPGILGQVIFRTDTNRFKIKAASGWFELVDLTSTQTLTNKTLTTPQINTGTLTTPIISQNFQINESVVTPSTPPSGSHKVYIKEDGLMYQLDSTGVESPVSFIPDAADISYNNSTSNLTATDVQDAIDEVLTKSVPTGTVLMWAASTTPSNYLPCDGSAVSRTTYANLFSVISTTYGIGNGSTTFNLPNFLGLVPRGIGQQTVNGRLKDGGILLGNIQEDQMQRITGSVTSVQLRNSASRTDAGALTSTASSSTTAGLNTNTQNILTGFAFDSSTSPDARTSATTAGETRVSSIGINFIIKT